MMTAAKVDVSVFDGPDLIQTWPCTRAAMPDGAPAVIWRGVVYALLPGDRIDIGAAPSVARPAHTVLRGEAASWVLMQGQPSALREAEEALVSGGIAVARSGRWLGEPVGGVAFDWYLRTDGPLDAVEIAALLGAAPPAAAASDDALARAFVLEQQITALLADVARLRQEAEARAAQAISVTAPPDAVHDAAANAEIAARRFELDEMQARLEQARVDRATFGPAPLDLHDELKMAFDKLRPDIVLLRGSLMIAVGEFVERKGFYRAIGELLASGARPEGWKMLRGTDRWWERHVSNGQDNTGRAYARFDTERRCWEVLLGWKGEQGKDIAWLGRA